LDTALRNVTDPDSYLHAKETLIAFTLTLEVQTSMDVFSVVLTPFNSLGISIFNIVSTHVDLPPIQEVRHFTQMTI